MIIDRKSLKLVLDEVALSPPGDSKLPCSTARGAQVIEKCWLLSKVIEIISILLERSKTARSTPTMTTIRHAEGRNSSALYQVLEMVRELVEIVHSQQPEEYHVSHSARTLQHRRTRISWIRPAVLSALHSL